jgi:hypothetical protein
VGFHQILQCFTVIPQFGIDQAQQEVRIHVEVIREVHDRRRWQN